MWSTSSNLQVDSSQLHPAPVFVRIVFSRVGVPSSRSVWYQPDTPRTVTINDYSWTVIIHCVLHVGARGILGLPCVATVNELLLLFKRMGVIREYLLSAIRRPLGRWGSPRPR